ncbi:MAG: U32 family peptidase [Alphaproteobacteria bacterium]|nr:U32 family peptidase [Alphaproteobacteria bacterium]
MKSVNSKPARLTLGPLFYNWPAEKKRDFYFRIADEAAVDCVYLGEVVCSKREPFFEPYRSSVLERLQKAGKQVVHSTLAIVTTEREIAAIRHSAESGALIEANDVAAMQALAGKPFVVGPFINVLNEGALDFVLRHGAKRVAFASELSGEGIRLLAEKCRSRSAISPPPFEAGVRGGTPKKPDPSPAKTKDLLRKPKFSLPLPHGARDLSGIETEVQVFGRQPLSVSMRCYHARAHDANKDTCKFACEKDPDGLQIDTLDDQHILTVNGTQTLTRGYVVLLKELAGLGKAGVTHFRIAPQNVDMVRVLELYRAVLDSNKDPLEAQKELKRLTKIPSFVNGFFHKKEGLVWVD